MNLPHYFHASPAGQSRRKIGYLILPAFPTSTPPGSTAASQHFHSKQEIFTYNRKNRICSSPSPEFIITVMGNTHSHHHRSHKTASNTPSEIELQDLDPVHYRHSGCFSIPHHGRTKASSWRHQRRKAKAAKRNSAIYDESDDNAAQHYESRRKRIVAMIKDPTFW